MNRYMVFAGNSYYAQGGWFDFKDSFTIVKKAIEYGNNLLEEDYLKPDWFHVVDFETGKIINKLEGSYCGKKS